MTAPTENYIRDGFIAPVLGMNQGVNPLRMNKDEHYRFGLNVSSRGGLLHTRPNFIKTSADLPDGKFQGSQLFSLNSGDRIVCVIGGVICTIYVNVSSIAEYTVVQHSQTLSGTVDQVYFTQADQYLVIQDGVSDPVVIYEKTNDYLAYTGRRDVTITIPEDADIDTVPDEEGEESGLGTQPIDYGRGGRIPKGTILQYAHGRIFLVPVVVPDTEVDGRRFFIAGDIMLPSDTLTALWFTENTYLSNGGAICPPFESGFIGGMGILRASASGTGYGSLIVFGRYGVSAFSVQAARETWGTIDFSSVLFFDSGTVSPRSVLNVNNDLMYRDADGIRSLAYTTTSRNNSLTNKPISNEVSKLLSADTGDALPFVSSAVIDNRVFFTSQPVTVNDEQCFRGIISYDLSAFYSMTQQYPPVYDGIWTGLNFLEVITCRGASGDRLLHIFHKESDGSNLLYYMAKDETTYEDEGSSKPLVRIYTAPMFTENSHVLKQLKGVDLWLNNIKGEVTVKVYYRRYGYELWKEFNSHVLNADMTEDDAKAQSRWNMRFMIDDLKACDQFDVLTIVGHMFDFCIEWQGHCEISKFSTFAIPVDRANQFTYTCSDESAIALRPGERGIDLDNFTYEIGD